MNQIIVTTDDVCDSSMIVGQAAPHVFDAFAFHSRS
jgi:hypothetical protein